MSTPLPRRDFLKVAGGGITVFFSVGIPLPPSACGGSPEGGAAQQRGQSGYPSDLNAYLRIHENGRVSLFTGKIEMGQGIITSLAQMMADELDVPFSRVDVVLGDTELCPWDMGTFGSLTTRMFGPALRQACATARAVLLELAGERLGVPPQRLTAETGEVFDPDTPSQRVTFAELAHGQRIQREASTRASPKRPEERTVSGRPAPRTDAHAKVNGEALYAGDMRPAGLLCASILRPPSHGARLLAVDTSGAGAVEGARVVEEGDLIAVLHERPDLAARALERVRAEWEPGPSAPDHEGIFEHLEANAPDPSVYQEAGDLARGRAASARTVESSWYNHYVAHAPMEPHTATVEIRGNRVTVWPSSQTPFGVQREVAAALGVPAEQVRVISPLVGGGFGGKTANRQAVEAARLARSSGRPVQVAWTRKEEFFYDTYRPAALVKFSSGVDPNGRIVFWDYDNFFGGDRSADVFYDVPNLRVRTRAGWQQGSPAHPFAVGAWRGPASSTNAFAMESQVDLMAEAAGMDPLAFRLHNLTDPRMRAILEAAVDRFGGPLPRAPSGRGIGLACTIYHDTYVAMVAQVQVDRVTGEVKVLRVVAAQDMGEVVNPLGAQLQMEGCIAMGLGYALREGLRFQGGKILDENFGSYTLPRFSWTPRIETLLIPRPELPPSGGGEPAITPVGAVLANAVYDAVGARCFTLPMTPERVRAAMG